MLIQHLKYSAILSKIHSTAFFAILPTGKDLIKRGTGHEKN